MKKVPLMMGLAAALCSLIACRKESETVSPAPVAATANRSALLASGAWHQTNLVVATTGADKKVASADLFAHVSASRLDQLASFQADGTYTLRKGGILAQPKTGHWQLNAASDSVVLTLPGQVRRLAVTNLTDKSLSLAFTGDAANGSVSTYTAVYAH